MTDLSLEEIKKQAAVQCLRSASDEVSIIIIQLDWCNPVIFVMFINGVSQVTVNKININLNHFHFGVMQVLHYYV